jgi:hypothetical protein
MNHPQVLQVSGEIAPAAGIDEKLSVAGRLVPACIGGVHRHIALIQGKAGDAALLANLRPGLGRVPEQEMIERGAFNLERARLPGEPPAAKDELQLLRAVPNEELRSPLLGT